MTTERKRGRSFSTKPRAIRVVEKTPRNCIQCGKEFLAAFPKTRLCSYVCRTTVWRQLNPRPTRQCVVCGDVLEGHKMAYCKEECKRRHKVKNPDRQCIICKGYIPGKGFKYCSKACSLRVKYRGGRYMSSTLRSLLIEMATSSEVPDDFRDRLRGEIKDMIQQVKD